MALSQGTGLVVICGPTATGKSKLAIALAQKLETIILGADSRQVYQGFDIGTAKPTPSEQEQVPHRLIDICEPTASLTVAAYQAQAQAYISASHREPRSRVPLLVGGTGLYIRAVVRGLKIPQVPPQVDLRSQLVALGQSQCVQFLQQVDPLTAARVHPRDQVRTLRALEVFYATGQPLSHQQGEQPPPYPILQIGLDCGDRQALRQRVHHRTAQMIAMGLVAEVQQLLERYGPSLPLLQTLGYREIKGYLAGTMTLAEAQDQIVLHTAQLAKRQRTWFRAVPEIEWFDADAPDLDQQVWRRIQAWMSPRGSAQNP